MGVSIGLSSGDSYIINPINPNPHDFKIKEFILYPNCTYLKVLYPNCTNFEGEKILVFHGKVDKSKITYLDPHFNHLNLYGDQLIARFHPKMPKMAKRFCENY